jgi:hypothetical protein
MDRAWRVSAVLASTCVALALAGCGEGDSHPRAAATPTATGGSPVGQTPTVTPTPACPTQAETPGEEPFGAEMPSADAFAAGAKCLLPAAFTAGGTPPPRATIPPTALPPVQAQGTTAMPGSPGSCEVWSAGYAMGSYAANVTNHQSLMDLANTVSPGFLYPWVLNLENETCGTGTAASDTLDYLVANTAPSLAAVPYAPYCSCLEMIDINQTFQTDLRIGSWCYFPTDAATALAAMKGYVAQGRVVQASIYVPWEFGDYTGGVFDVPTSCPTPDPTPATPSCAVHDSTFACVHSAVEASGCAQHGIAVVGYDDTMVGPDGMTGAVLIMNSFGPSWGENGFMWMSYAGFQDIYFGGTAAFPPQPSGGLSGGFAVPSAFQWVENGTADPPHVHLIFEAARSDPLIGPEVRITAPDGHTVRHHYAHPFRHGYLYLTRSDGHQFEPGAYTLELRSGDGPAAQATVTVALDPESDRAPAALPAALTGTDGQPATVEP